MRGLSSCQLRLENKTIWRKIVLTNCLQELNCCMPTWNNPNFLDKIGHRKQFLNISMVSCQSVLLFMTIDLTESHFTVGVMSTLHLLLVNFSILVSTHLLLFVSFTWGKFMYFATISADMVDGIWLINKAGSGVRWASGRVPVAANCCQLLTPSIILTMLCLARDILRGMGQGLCAKCWMQRKEAESVTWW